ncbi:PASTA domain-containing protein [Pseudolysinimonas sp.]|uniref:PASTA domain-containing protein n=1 Tax=Pseudolysinimonas sp. TaxID=2680009 RepID=UPI0037841A06
MTAPLTTVPAPESPVLVSVLEALDETADGCALDPTIVTTFPENPDALRGVRPPSAEQMAGWSVASLTPESGRAILCEQTIRVDLIWPKTVMPGLVGLFHSPSTAQAVTATTSALEAVGLLATCSGKGTVTSQSPAAGDPVPIGTAVTCIAELVMPSVVGMDPTSAEATLAAAGVTASGSGSGVVVSQSPAAGTKLTSAGGATFYAEQPRPAPVAGGGYAYYENCTAARAAGAAPIRRGEPGYAPKLDRDNDGIACE